ncbi:MAG: pentapeptide repeat-containing protein [Candidatus Sericytochromatia bacterium]
MVVWLIGIAMLGFILWAVWHEQQLRRQSGVLVQQRETLSEQRRALAEQQLQERVQQRTQSSDEALAWLAADERMPEALQTLATLLPQSTADEQWRLLTALCERLQARYGGQPLEPPLPPELLPWLQLLSKRPEGFRGRGGQRDCLRLQDLQLPGLELTGFNLRGAELRACNFAAARLPGLDLFAASCEAVCLEAAELAGANLTGASFTEVRFDRARLSKAELITAELRDCSLQEADLSGAALRGVRLSRCDLRGANLAGATGLSYQQLLSCRLDAHTRLPDNLEPRRAELLARSQGT